MLKVIVIFVGFVAGIASARDVCETRVCIERAKQFLDSMDTSINPCDDFYQFSCGRFLRNNNFDQEEKTVSVFTQLEADLQIKLRKSLMKIDSSDEDTPEFMREMKDLYDKCLDTDQIEVDGMPSLITLLEFIEGRGFIDANWTWPEFKLERRVRLFTKAGFGSDFLVDLDFIPNLKNTSELIINFSHAGDFDEQTLFRRLGEVKEGDGEAPEGQEEEEEVDEEAQKELSRYAAFIVSIARHLGSPLSSREVTDIIILNRRLLMAALEIVELKKNVENLVNIMTVDEMQTTYPRVNWTEYIRAKTFDRIPVTDSMRVNIMEVGYFHTLMEILNDTNSKTIANFQTLKAIINHMDRVSRGFRNLKNRMANSGTAAPKPIPRWRTCVSDIVEDFGMGISYVYVKDYGSENLKNFSIDMITRLKEQYELMLSKSKWFDEETYQKAKEKLNAVVNQIAYSDELLNLTMVQNYYKGLRFENVSYFDSILLLTRLNHNRNVDNYLDTSEFTNLVEFVEVTVVNGFYIPFANSIQIPMGILQSKFIDLDAPLFLNYGSMGFTMAHELSHAFDDFGRQFDWKGNVANWYSDRATELNSEKEKCIIDKFNEFTEPETKLQINGNNTLTENIADLGGILIAYYTYKNAPNRQDHDSLPLPGLNYTLDQQFWLAYSTNWCSSYRNSTLKSMIEYDMHAPAAYRIIGSLQNVPEFARDFNCAPGTPMNPTAKCTVF